MAITAPWRASLVGARFLHYCCRAISLSAGLWLAFSAVRAEEANLGKATSSAAARDDAIRSIPFSQMSAEAQRRISAIVTDPSMYRRMPISLVDCDPDLHQFMIRNPEVMVNIWQLMGITKVTAQRTGPFTWDCTDGVGTVTRMELVFGNDDTHLILCEGAYDGPLFLKSLTGRCLLIMKSGRIATPEQRVQITNRLDMFLQIDHAGVNVFTKTLHPLMGKSADINFLESMNFLQRVSIAAEANGPGMQQMSGRLANVQPDVRERFSQVINSVYERGLERMSNLPNEASRPAANRALNVRSATIPRASLRVAPTTIQR